MSQLVIDLSSDELATVAARAADEGYASPAAYVKDVLKRELAEDEPDPLAEDQEREALAYLDQLVQEGLDSGEPIPITDEYWERRRQAFLARHPNG
jgi:hypothetical protein